MGVLWLVISACSSPASPSVPHVQGFWHGGWVADSCIGQPAASQVFYATISGTFMPGTFACTVNISGTFNSYSLTGRLQNVSLFSPDPSMLF